MVALAWQGVYGLCPCLFAGSHCTLLCVPDAYTRFLLLLLLLLLLMQSTLEGQAFDVLLLDESSQMTEPTSLVPLLRAKPR
jgi:hypothetical protein